MKTQETAYARNLRRLMAERGLRPTPLSIRAGLSRTYIHEVLTGKILSPGVDATRKIAVALGVDPSELLRAWQAPEGLDVGREKTSRERALRAAEKAIGEGSGTDHSALVFRAAGMIYDVIVEREAALGRPIEETDEEFWFLIDAMVRRWIAESR